jgi:hypothetical protein
MKTLKIVLILFFFTIVCAGYSQDNNVVLKRTPEQEAMKQTEKLQQELNLSPEQIKQLYDINLKYEKERQISNKRSEAVERMKNKNADIQQVLTAEQNEKLLTKRYQRTNTEVPVNQNRPVNATFRANQEYRINPTTIRVPSVTVPTTQNSFRAVIPTNSSQNRATQTQSTQSTQLPQAVRRESSTESSTRISTPPATRSAVSPSPSYSPTPSAAPQQRTETPSSTNRR